MSLPETYSISKSGIFWSVQGEGHLRGFQMAFVRLAGCSVGCEMCDTDYSRHQRLTSVEIAIAVSRIIPAANRDRWVWITGGEPADYDLRPLISALREQRCSVAVASSGHKRIIPPVDWLSISPHSAGRLVQTYGNEIKLIDGLNGLDLDEFVTAQPDEQTDFWYRYVQPLTLHGLEQPESLARCIDFVRRHPNWALSRQDHLIWGCP